MNYKRGLNKKVYSRGITIKFEKEQVTSYQLQNRVSLMHFNMLILHLKKYPAQI